MHSSHSPVSSPPFPPTPRLSVLEADLCDVFLTEHGAVAFFVGIAEAEMSIGALAFAGVVVFEEGAKDKEAASLLVVGVGSTKKSSSDTKSGARRDFCNNNKKKHERGHQERKQTTLAGSGSGGCGKARSLTVFNVLNN